MKNVFEITLTEINIEWLGKRINSPLNTGTPLRALMDQDRNVLKTTAHRI